MAASLDDPTLLEIVKATQKKKLHLLSKKILSATDFQISALRDIIWGPVKYLSDFYFHSSTGVLGGVSCVICEIFKNIFFHRIPPVAASF